MNQEDQKRFAKLDALRNRPGTDGERQAAQEAINRLMQRLGVEEHDLAKFRPANPTEKPHISVGFYFWSGYYKHYYGPFPSELMAAQAKEQFDTLTGINPLNSLVVEYCANGTWINRSPLAPADRRNKPTGFDPKGEFDKTMLG